MWLSRPSHPLHVVAILLFAFLLIGCTVDPPAPPPDAPAVIEKTSEAAASETAYPIASEDGAASLEAQSSDSGEREIGDGAQPGVVARIHVTEDPHRIADLRHDSSSGRLFAATSDGRLIVLDDREYDVIREFPFSGELTLDVSARRLFVAPGSQYVPENQAITVYVVDMDALEVVAQVEGVHCVSLDQENGRLFAGSPLRSFEDERGADSIHVYDLESLAFLYDIEQKGIPTYNPYRDELFVTAYTALVVDPVTGQVLDDLMPELASQPFAWCNGCEYAGGVYILDTEDVAVVERNVVSTGGGPGFSPDDLYLDARTLKEVDAFVCRSTLQPVCSTRRIPVPPISGRVIRQPHYVRYVIFRNFDLYNLEGELEDWRDGLFAQYINPRTQQAYTSQGYVLDLNSLTPAGRLPDFCALDEDVETGRIFGRIDGDLIVIDENGGFTVTAPPTEPEPLPAVAITQILVSPEYPSDHTVFLLLEDSRLYRSSDGGDTWMRVQGGLPVHEYLTLNVALSPDFGSDETMFAGGFVGDYRGEGVLRSTDAGMTWQPLWNGLSHLRVYDLRVSPSYAEDGAVQALARYTRLAPWETGVSLHVSADRGLTWSQAFTATNESKMEDRLDAEDLAMIGPTRFHIVDYGDALTVMGDNGEWRHVDLQQGDGEKLRAVVPSPAHEEESTYYLLGDYSLWRTTDEGKTWSEWQDARLEGRDYAKALTALAVTPQFPDGSHRLLLGTYAGEFWMLSPSDALAVVDAPPASAPDLSEPTHSEGTAPAADTEGGTDAELSDVEPPDGMFFPDGALASVWEASPDFQASLGWALTELATDIPAAYQPFEHGAMLWNGRDHSIVVVYDDGAWESFPDTFAEGEPEFDPNLSPPDDRLQPIRGFGKLWRGSQDIRDRLGWALQEELGYTPYYHEFERGYLIGSPSGTLALIRESESGGHWR